MDPIFIRVQCAYGKQDIDIKESTYEQRHDYYNSLGKGQIVSILEKYIENKMIEEYKDMLRKVVSALDDVTEEYNCGVYDDLIKKTRELINKNVS